VASSTKDFGGARSDSGGSYQFTVTYTDTNPRGGPPGRFILVRSEPSRPPDIIDGSNPDSVNRYLRSLDSTITQIGNYLTKSLNNAANSQRSLDAALASGDATAAANHRIALNYFTKEAAATRQNLAAAQATASEIQNNSSSALAALVPAAPPEPPPAADSGDTGDQVDDEEEEEEESQSDDVPQQQVYTATQNQIARASSQTAGDAVSTDQEPSEQDAGTNTTGGEPITASELDNIGEFEDIGELFSTTDQSLPQKTRQNQANTEDNTDPGDSITKLQVKNTAPPPVPKPNPLLELSSYTYGISLHILDEADYKTLLNNPQSFKVTKNIVSSASRYTDVRRAEFREDFYFDNLSMITAMGLGSNTQGTNAITLKFKLIEPYGMSFMNRLLDVSRTLGIKNYVEQPYLLEINFFGYNDAGEIQKIPGFSKWIPIKLLTMRIRASSRGSEYDIDAVPYGQLAHMESIQAIRANFEVTASKVGEYFSSSLSFGSGAVTAAVGQQVRNDEERKESEAELKKIRTNNVGPGPLSDDDADRRFELQENIKNISQAPTVAVSSFPGAYNLWLAQEQSHGYMEIADVIAFDIDSAIASATVAIPAKTSGSRTGGSTNSATGTGTTNPAADTGNNPEIQSKSPKRGPDFSRLIKSVNAGTSINSIINNVIINSSFIRDQLNGAESEKKNSPITSADSLLKATGAGAGGSIKWFKIIPKIELLGYDNKRNKYAKKITYYIKTYDHYNNADPRVPKGLPAGAVKEYDYIYTGNNESIIDFDIEFDSLYNILVNVSRSKTEALNTAGGANPNKIYVSTESQPPGNFSAPGIVYTSGSHRSLANGGADMSENQLAAGYAESIYSTTGGQMVNVRLKILGDPDFIKQDEFLFHPGVLGLGYNSQYLPGQGNSLNMDSSEIYAILRFKTPVDIDESTGMLRKDSAYSVSYFSGFYKIVTIENHFGQGKFTQVLDMVRVLNQPGDTKSTGSVSADTNRPAGQQTSGITAAPNNINAIAPPPADDGMLEGD
jgi:hypothetical protein